MEVSKARAQGARTWKRRSSGPDTSPGTPGPGRLSRIGWRTSGLCALAAILLFPGGTVTGDVLYDSTSMTDDGTWDVVFLTFIGGLADFSEPRDVQASDDFQLDVSYLITAVTADYATPGDPPTDGVLVEFFENVDGTPAESAIAAVLASSIQAIPILEGAGYRLTVELIGEHIALGAGTWWVSITPVDLTPEGEIFRHLGSTAGAFGNDSHIRDGGVDHGNGYAGFHGVNDWTLGSEIGNFEDRDLAMRIEGSRFADLDGDGSVGVADLLMLLAAWGECAPKGDCVADLNGDNTVGVSDLLILLSEWG